MYKLIFTLTLLSAYAFGSAQNNNVASVTGRAYAYSQRVAPGNVMVDNNGNEVKRDPKYNNFIYIETKGSAAPDWKVAWINGKPYTLQGREITDKVDVGTPEGGDTPITIAPRKGYKLWLFSAISSPKERKPLLTRSQKSAKVVLQGTYNNKAALYTISKVTLLEPLHMY